MLLWIKFFIFLLENWTEILKCQNPWSIVNFVDEVMDLYFSWVNPDPPHRRQQWSITYFSISIPIKVVKSFSVESSFCFIQIILISGDSKDSGSAAENFHFSEKKNVMMIPGQLFKERENPVYKNKGKNIPLLAFFPFCAIILQLKTKFSLIQGKRLTGDLVCLPLTLTFSEISFY